MKQQRTLVLCSCALIFLLLFSHPLSVTAQEVEDEREFDYIEGSEKGPAQWGDVKREWADCRTGRLQSPIDMYDMELHMLHTTSEQKIAVIGYLYKIGKPDAFLSKLLNDIMSMTDQILKRNIGIVDPREIKFGGKKYYRYMGSLTTPPCKQGVIWTINKKIRTISKDQVRALRVAVHDVSSQN
ncbi:hypothetical protein POTOM_023232 [Populus tomentosa]|uniref:Alpha-carbonic anhydrase domain-containing protein n=1 Tax=Populus tomentosa TaxID=118781 RepID=A0A8X7ZMV0_POPTO|nr:hypothetical protein POTOM_023232 [Populus tomentosa]